MKKGQTESYSFLIGIIIAVLILTAIGCAVYNMYKPRGTESFDKLLSNLKGLEKKGDVEGEYALFLEPNQFIVGFSKGRDAFEYSPNCPSGIGSEYREGPIDWGCYGINFLRPKEGVSIIAWPSWELAKNRPMRIQRPEKCSEGKSCLCLCEMDRLGERPFFVSETACSKSTVKCFSLDTIELIGGEGCCEGVFIPGKRLEEGSKEEERGLRVVNYKKFGSMVSLDDEGALIGAELIEALEKQKKEAEKQFFDSIFKKFDQCFKSEKIDCNCGGLDLIELEKYKIKLIPYESDRSEYVQFSFIDKDENEIDLEKEKYQLITTVKDFGIICDGNKIALSQILDKNACDTIMLSAEGAEFSENCCTKKIEWRNKNKLYLLNFQEGAYLSITSENLQLCSKEK